MFSGSGKLPPVLALQARYKRVKLLRSSPASPADSGWKGDPRMAKATKSKKKPIDQYDHKGKKRVNNPPVGLVTPETDKETGKKQYAYDPHLDPQLVWSGKAERTSFEVPTGGLLTRFLPL